MVALATSHLYIFDLEEFYKKIIKDFRFEQTENGGIPETAPYMGINQMGLVKEKVLFLQAIGLSLFNL